MLKAKAMEQEKIGLFGGSFNPVHNGHLKLADYLARHAGLGQVWLNLSPQNPLKAAAGLIDDNLRLEMLRAAVESNPRLQACDVELTMPRPSYTLDTLDLLSDLYPGRRFIPVIGADNWLIFDKWKQADRIIDRYGVIIYPRPGYAVPLTALPRGVTLVQAPLTDLSSTLVRQAIADGHDISDMVPQPVEAIIRTRHLYQHQV